MARETVAFSECHACQKSVAVKKDVGGKPYYHCDHCGFTGKFMLVKGGNAYLARIAPPPAPAPAGPGPAAPAAPAQPAATAKPPRSHGTLLG